MQAESNTCINTPIKSNIKNNISFYIIIHILYINQIKKLIILVKFSAGLTEDPNLAALNVFS